MPYDYIVAMDVLEHVVDYKAFVQAAYSILAPKGKFIFMSPIIYEDRLVREIDFIAREHAHIFSIKYIRELLEWAGFSEAIEDRFIVGHELRSAVK